MRLNKQTKKRNQRVVDPRWSTPRGGALQVPEEYEVDEYSSHYFVTDISPTLLLESFIRCGRDFGQDSDPPVSRNTDS